MGAPLPVISGREAAKIFERLGWRLLRRRGSHMVYGKPTVPANLSIPNHRELAAGTLRAQIRSAQIRSALIRSAQISVEDFIAARES